MACADLGHWAGIRGVFGANAREEVGGISGGARRDPRGGRNRMMNLTVGKGGRRSHRSGGEKTWPQERGGGGGVLPVLGFTGRGSRSRSRPCASPLPALVRRVWAPVEGTSRRDAGSGPPGSH